MRTLGEGVVTYQVLPDVGTAAWNSCAGSLPWGQPTDQRYDDAASLTWEWPAEEMSLLGHPRLRVRLTSSEPVATLSAKLCDLFPDGTSSLLSRGLLNLTHRSSSTAPSALPVGEWVDVDLELEAMSWDAAPGHVLRLSVAGVDWPNTVAPPRPVTVSIDRSASSLVLPVAGRSVPATGLPLLPAPEDDDAGAGITWRVERDVLGGRTACVDAHGSSYVVDGGRVREHYTGRVEVATESFAQRAEASADFTVVWEGVAVRSRAELAVDAGPTAYDVDLVVETWEDGEPFASRHWQRHVPRDLG
jgi:hypothetical protein